MAAQGIDCSNGFEEACELMRVAERCLGGALDVAFAGSTFPMPDPRTGDASAYGETAVGAYLDYKAAEAKPYPSAFGTASLAFKLFGVVNTMLTIKSAYDGCAPR